MWLLNIYLQIRLHFDETFTGQIKRLLRSWRPGWVFRRCCAVFNYPHGQKATGCWLMLLQKHHHIIPQHKCEQIIARSANNRDNNRHHLQTGLCSNGVQGYTHTHVWVCVCAEPPLPPAAAGLLTSRPGHRNKMAHGQFVHVSLLAEAALWQVWPPHSFWFSTAALEGVRFAAAEHFIKTRHTSSLGWGAAC